MELDMNIHRRFFSEKLRHAALLAACAGLTGCAAPSNSASENSPSKSEPPNSEQLSKFTTVGKPTMTIETPWGPRDIYDPSQDDAVLEAIKDVYNSDEDIAFGELARWNATVKTQPNSNPQAELIRLSRNVQYNDMMRLGCRHQYVVPCQRFGASYFEQLCEESVLGKPELSQCERENMKIDAQIPMTAFTPPVDKFSLTHLKGENPYLRFSASRCVVAGITNMIQPPLIVGETSGYSLSETQRILTTSDCATWIKTKK